MDTILTFLAVCSGTISLFLLVYKPFNANSISLEKNILEIKNLNNSMQELIKRLDQNEKKGEEEIERLWQHNRKQDKILNDHALSITIIEREVGIDAGKRTERT